MLGVVSCVVGGFGCMCLSPSCHTPHIPHIPHTSHPTHPTHLTHPTHSHTPHTPHIPHTPHTSHTPHRTVLRTAMWDYFQFIFWFLVATLLWHITPHFICDILFYLILWHTLYMHIILSNLVKYIKGRRERNRLQREQNLLEVRVNWRNN